MLKSPSRCFWYPTLSFWPLTELLLNDSALVIMLFHPFKLSNKLCTVFDPFNLLNKFCTHTNTQTHSNAKVDKLLWEQKKNYQLQWPQLILSNEKLLLSIGNYFFIRGYEKAKVAKSPQGLNAVKEKNSNDASQCATWRNISICRTIAFLLHISSHQLSFLTPSEQNAQKQISKKKKKGYHIVLKILTFLSSNNTLKAISSGLYISVI